MMMALFAKPQTKKTQMIVSLHFQVEQLKLLSIVQPSLYPHGERESVMASPLNIFTMAGKDAQ